MKKAELMQLLKRGLDWEEEFVLQYDRDYVWEFLRTLGPEKFAKIEKLMKENISDTNRHYTMLKNLIGKVERGDYGNSV
jgi:hypothetical protein